MLIQIDVLHAHAFIKRIVLQDLFLQLLEMDFAMTIQIMPSVIMIAGTVVSLQQVQIIAQNADAMAKNFVQLESFLHPLEMAFAMMKQIMNTATMMALTVAKSQ